MCLAQELSQGSDAGEGRNQGASYSSQALYHWATELPSATFDFAKLGLSLFGALIVLLKEIF